MSTCYRKCHICTNVEPSIAITYSVISPIINGLAFVTFVLFYFLWKYLFLWQLDQPRSSDSGGLFYPRALQHVFVGMYLQQICLAALFFLARDQNNKASAIPEGALMIVLIVLTVRAASFCYLSTCLSENCLGFLPPHFKQLLLATHQRHPTQPRKPDPGPRDPERTRRQASGRGIHRRHCCRGAGR